jgi:hypothetical protein
LNQAYKKAEEINKTLLKELPVTRWNWMRCGALSGEKQAIHLKLKSLKATRSRRWSTMGLD